FGRLKVAQRSEGPLFATGGERSLVFPVSETECENVFGSVVDVPNQVFEAPWSRSRGIRLEPAEKLAEFVRAVALFGEPNIQRNSRVFIAHHPASRTSGSRFPCLR